MSIASAVTKTDASGRIIESHVHSVEIYEYSTRAEAEQEAPSNKERFLAIVASQADVELKKGKRDGQVYKVGRAWRLEQLTGLESVSQHSLAMVLGKDYFYRFKSSSDKRDFCVKLEHVYRKKFGRPIPRKLGFEEGWWPQGAGGQGVPQGAPQGAPQGQGYPNQGGQGAPQAHPHPNHTPAPLQLRSNAYPVHPGQSNHAAHSLQRRPSQGPASPTFGTGEFPPQLSMPPKQRYRPGSPKISSPPMGSQGFLPHPQAQGHPQGQGQPQSKYPQGHPQHPQMPQMPQMPGYRRSRGSGVPGVPGVAQNGRLSQGQPVQQAHHPAQQMQTAPLRSSGASQGAQRTSGAPVQPVAHAPQAQAQAPVAHAQAQAQALIAAPAPRSHSPQRSARSQSPQRSSQSSLPPLLSQRNRRNSAASNQSLRNSASQTGLAQTSLAPQVSPRSPKRGAAAASASASAVASAQAVAPLAPTPQVQAAPPVSPGLTQPRTFAEPALPEVPREVEVPQVQQVQQEAPASAPAAPDWSQAERELTAASPAPTSRRTQSDASDASFKSALDHRLSRGDLGASGGVSGAGTSSARLSVPVLDTPELRRLRRLSPVAVPRSPRRSVQLGHARTASNVSVPEQTDAEAFRDLHNVLVQLQDGGRANLNAPLEAQISARVAVLNDTQTASVASLDGALGALDALLAESERECQDLVDTFAHVAVQLATIAPQIASIEGKSEGSQVLEMNKRLLAEELERLIETVHLPSHVTKVLLRTAFALQELPEVEESLCELYKAHEVLASGGNIALEQAETINTTTESFDLEFAAWFKKRLANVLGGAAGGASGGAQSAGAGGMTRIDTSILSELYPYAGLVLFAKDTLVPAYDKMLDFYQDTLRGHYDERVPLYIIGWKRRLDAIKAAFSFKSTKPKPKAEDQSTALLKRGMSLKHEARYQHKALAGQADTRLATYLSLCDELVDGLSVHIAAQQQVLVHLFHLSSGVAKFDVYVHRNPLKVRQEQAYSFEGAPAPQAPESSRKTAQTVHRILAQIFGSLEENLRKCTDVTLSQRPLESIYLIGLIELRLDMISTSDQEFAKAVLTRWREALVPQWRKWVESQSRIILETHFNMSKRVGIVGVAEQFVAYCQTVEACLGALGSGQGAESTPAAPKTRAIVSESHKHVFRAVTQIFDRQQPRHIVSGGSEDKEALNLHVTTIENLHVVISGLASLDSDTIEPILTSARTIYRRELEAYIDDVEQRPLGRLLEFCGDGPAAAKIKPSTFKKVVSGYDAKELRKQVEVLRKRVQKHFGDDVADSALVAKIWSALSAEFESKIGKLQALAKQHDAEAAMVLTKAETREVMRSLA